MTATSFRYRALDGQGREVRGEVQAGDQAGALGLLRRRGLSAFSLQPDAGPKAGIQLRRGPPRPGEIERFARQLATLSEAQVPLPETLSSLRRTAARPVMAERTDAMLRAVRSGRSLSDALTEHLPEAPGYLPRLVELGEEAGALPRALSDAADRIEAEQAARAELRAALAYPAFLLVAGTAIVLGLFAFVVPRFSGMLPDDLAGVPWLSQQVLRAGLAAEGRLLPIIACLVGAGVLARAFGPSLAKALGGVSEIPVIGPLLDRSQTAGWARTLGVALTNKASLMQALRLGEAGVTSARFRAELEQVRASVRAGHPLEEALAAARPRTDPLVLDVIRTGRSSGRLGEMMLFAASIYEREAKARSKQVAALAEPLAVLLIAIIVGTVIVSIVLAMTSVYDVAV